MKKFKRTHRNKTPGLRKVNEEGQLPKTSTGSKNGPEEPLPETWGEGSIRLRGKKLLGKKGWVVAQEQVGNDRCGQTERASEVCGG